MYYVILMQYPGYRNMFKISYCDFSIVITTYHVMGPLDVVFLHPTETEKNK